MSRRVRGVTVGAVFGVALAGGGLLVNRALASGGGDVSGRRLFDEVYAKVAAAYVDSLPADSLYTKAVAGLLGELHDPYSVYLTAQRLTRFKETTSGRYAGIGIQVDVRDRRIIVLSTLPGGPAEAAGVQPGDRLVSVGGKDALGLLPEEATKALRGAPGSQVTIAVERAGVPTPIPLTITRQLIQVHAVQRAQLLPGTQAGYVDVRTFSDSTAEELARAVDSLVRAGAKSLVLDLRGNPGGLVEQGVAVADLFLDPGQAVVSLKGRTDDVTRSFTDRAPQRWPSLPLVVLVDRSSASAAEIVAGALQDHDRAVVVGQTTFGKGSAQQIFEAGGGAVKLTTSLWFTPIGRSITRRPKLDEDGHPVVVRAGAETAADSAADADSTRIPYRTDKGRTVYGGGGITPDVVVRDSAAFAQLAGLTQLLGRDVPKFRDALTAQALSLKGTGALAPGFAVTPAMLAGLGGELRARGVEGRVADSVLAAPHAALAARLLGYEAARYAFGRDAEWARRSGDDVALQRALALLKDVPGRDALLARAAQAAAKPAAGSGTGS